MIEVLSDDHPLRVAMKAAQDFVEDYIAGYEFEGDEGTYTPKESERLLITDAIDGLLDDDFLRLCRAEINEREKLRQAEGDCIECGRHLPEHWGGCAQGKKGNERG